MNSMKKIWMPALLAVVVGCDAGPTGPVDELQADLGFLPQVEVGLPEIAPEGDVRHDPSELAGRWIHYAQSLLREAIELAGPRPEPRVAGALRQAEHLLDGAKRAYEAREFDNAIRLAKESASISMRVIRFLEDGHSRDPRRPDAVRTDAERPVDAQRPTRGTADAT